MRRSGLVSRCRVRAGSFEGDIDRAPLKGICRYIYICRYVEVDVDIDIDFGCFKGGFKISAGTAEWYISSYGTDFENSEIESRNLFRIAKGWAQSQVLKPSLPIGPLEHLMTILGSRASQKAAGVSCRARCEDHLVLVRLVLARLGRAARGIRHHGNAR